MSNNVRSKAAGWKSRGQLGEKGDGVCSENILPEGSGS